MAHQHNNKRSMPLNRSYNTVLGHGAISNLAHIVGDVGRAVFYQTPMGRTVATVTVPIRYVNRVRHTIHELYHCLHHIGHLLRPAAVTKYRLKSYLLGLKLRKLVKAGIALKRAKLHHFISSAHYLHKHIWGTLLSATIKNPFKWNSAHYHEHGHHGWLPPPPPIPYIDPPRPYAPSTKYGPFFKYGPSAEYGSPTKYEQPDEYGSPIKYEPPSTYSYYQPSSSENLSYKPPTPSYQELPVSYEQPKPDNMPVPYYTNGVNADAKAWPSPWLSPPGPVEPRSPDQFYTT